KVDAGVARVAATGPALASVAACSAARAAATFDDDAEAHPGRGVASPRLGSAALRLACPLLYHSGVIAAAPPSPPAPSSAKFGQVPAAAIASWSRDRRGRTPPSLPAPSGAPGLDKCRQR